VWVGPCVSSIDKSTNIQNPTALFTAPKGTTKRIRDRDERAPAVGGGGKLANVQHFEHGKHVSQGLLHVSKNGKGGGDLGEEMHSVQIRFPLEEGGNQKKREPGRIEYGSSRNRTQGPVKGKKLFTRTERVDWGRPKSLGGKREKTCGTKAFDETRPNNTGRVGRHQGPLMEGKKGWSRKHISGRKEGQKGNGLCQRGDFENKSRERGKGPKEEAARWGEWHIMGLSINAGTTSKGKGASKYFTHTKHPRHFGRKKCKGRRKGETSWTQSKESRPQTL